MSQTTQIPEAFAQEVSLLQADSRVQAVLQTATEKYRKAPDWITFYREVLGVEGILRKLFIQAEELEAFERSLEYAQIQHMIAKLRERKDDPVDDTEPTRVITVRLPRCMHESLKREAHLRQTSMNQLCISKLLQMIDNGLVPSD